MPTTVVVPGDLFVRNSYRPELSGLYGRTVMVYVLCQAHHVAQGKVRVDCDGLSALHSAIDESGVWILLYVSLTTLQPSGSGDPSLQ
jgi:hypothetical protein